MCIFLKVGIAQTNKLADSVKNTKQNQDLVNISDD
jgi:hypothetical protein